MQLGGFTTTARVIDLSALAMFPPRHRLDGLR
jgi:hypothetical protein